MKNIIYIIIFSIIMQVKISAAPNHGPVIKAFYAPYGAGIYFIPHEDLGDTEETSLRSGSGNKKDDFFNTLGGYSLSCGYFYDFLQFDLSCSKFKTDKTYVTEASYIGQLLYSNASLSVTELKGGYRFNNPGDTSYSWLYLGIRKTEIEVPYKHSSSESTGFSAGFYSFKSIGLNGDYEFVLTYDFFIGTCRAGSNRLKTEVNFKTENKYALDMGISGGLGIQYEPWDLAAVLKISPFLTERHYKGRYADSSAKTDMALTGIMIGIEIIFSIPDYRNNAVK